MKIVIETEELEKSKIPLDVFLYTLSLYFNNRITESTRRATNYLGYSVVDINDEAITKDGTSMVTRILSLSKSVSTKNDSFYLSIAEKMQELFPEGVKEGTHKYWKGAKGEVADKLRMIEFLSHTTFTEEEAIKATKEYISSFDSDDLEFMQILPNFIFKNLIINDKIDWQSNFITIIENNKNTKKENDH